MSVVKRSAAGLAALALVAAASACSASGSSSGSASGSSNASGNSGEIVVMTIGNWTQPQAGASYPQYPAGVQARAAAINAAGGINGRKVEVIACSDELSPDVAQQCARTAVQDHVAAIVGLQTQNEDSILPILAQAHIPAIGVSPFTDLGYQSPISFPDVSGYYGLTIGQGLQCAKAGAAKMSNLIPGGFGSIGQVNATLVKDGAQFGGASYTTQVQIPTNAPDLAPSVASATAAGESAVTGFAFDESSLIQAMRQTAPKTKLCTTTFNLSPQVLQDTSSIANGVMAPDDVVPPTADTPGTRMFAADMKAFNPSFGLTDVGLHEWLAMWTFQRVAETVKTVDAASILAAMGKVRNMDMGGITPAYSTVSTSTAYPRAFNTTVVFEVVQDGKLVLQDPSDPFVSLAPLFSKKFA